MKVITHHSDGTVTEQVIDNPEIRDLERRMKKAYADVPWCKCGDKQTFGRYPEDGQCSCGMYKHHVHCGNCDRISQIG